MSQQQSLSRFHSSATKQRLNHFVQVSFQVNRMLHALFNTSTNKEDLCWVCEVIYWSCVQFCQQTFKGQNKHISISCFMSDQGIGVCLQWVQKWALFSSSARNWCSWWSCFSCASGARNDEWFSLTFLSLPQVCKRLQGKRKALHIFTRKETVKLSLLGAAVSMSVLFEFPSFSTTPNLLKNSFLCKITLCIRKIRKHYVLQLVFR